jgi:hypothetical protein
MSDPDRVREFLRTRVRDAGRQYEEARRAFAEAREEAAGEPDRIVCRRHAEQREVAVDDEGRPACFDAGHPDCEGCAEDIRADCVETW